MSTLSCHIFDILGRWLSLDTLAAAALPFNSSDASPLKAASHGLCSLESLKRTRTYPMFVFEASGQVSPCRASWHKRCHDLQGSVRFCFFRRRDIDAFLYPPVLYKWDRQPQHNDWRSKKRVADIRAQFLVHGLIFDLRRLVFHVCFLPKLLFQPRVPDLLRY
jgi:hypothetical protein